MILSAHQPVYLPGILLFNKILLSDVLVFLGHVQYEPNSWQARNKIRNNSTDKEMYLSIPVKTKNKFGQPINKVEIANRFWIRKHLKSLYLTYHSRPFFDMYFPKLKNILEKERVGVAEINKAIILEIMDWLKISTKIINSEELEFRGTKTDMLVSICKTLGASGYISNKGASDYIKEYKFEESNIRHYWQNFRSPIYDQGKIFISDLSVIDLIFNFGPDAKEIIYASGTIEDSIDNITG